LIYHFGRQFGCGYGFFVVDFLTKMPILGIDGYRKNAEECGGDDFFSW